MRGVLPLPADVRRPQRRPAAERHAGGDLRWLSTDLTISETPELRGLDLPAAAARQPDDRDGPRRRRARCRPSWSTTCSCRRSPTRPSGSSATPPCSTCSAAGSAFSTDSFVVRPLFFPGGSIGDLAVNGTVNDLAMSGAQAAVPVGGVHPRGGHRPHPGRRGRRSGSGEAATRAGVRVVTGDTKVVESGHGDGVYVNTAGVGLVPDGVDIRPDRAEPGDVVIVSGDIGVHGVAIMSVREGLQFGTEVESDCQPLNGLVAAMLAASRRHPRAARPDPRRRGHLAQRDRQGLEGRRRARRAPAARSRRWSSNACAFLGLDPLQVANEGKLLAFVPGRRGRRRAGGDARAPGRAPARA